MGSNLKGYLRAFHLSIVYSEATSATSRHLDTLNIAHVKQDFSLVINLRRFDILLAIVANILVSIGT
jgi:hypothetical protein